jgi:hypothetical protein
MESYVIASLQWGTLSGGNRRTVCTTAHRYTEGRDIEVRASCVDSKYIHYELSTPKRCSG